MVAKLKERWYIFLAMTDAVGMSLARTRRTLRDLLDVILAAASLLIGTETLKNKLYAVLLMLCTLPVVFLEGDATASVLIAFIAVPMFFSKENWIL